MKKTICFIIIGYCVLTLMFLVVTAVMIATGHASPAASRTPVRRVVENQGKVVTIRGFVLDVKLLGTEDNMFTNVRIRAYGVPQDVSLLFCGYQGDRVNFGPMILKFEAVSPKQYQGIGCFTLVSADREEPK